MFICDFALRLDESHKLEKNPNQGEVKFLPINNFVFEVWV